MQRNITHRQLENLQKSNATQRNANKKQAAVRIVQICVRKHGGLVGRLICDDKGTRFKIMFGMPSQSHADDAARCVRACLEVQARLQNYLDYDFDTTIGIATGACVRQRACVCWSAGKRTNARGFGFFILRKKV